METVMKFMGKDHDRLDSIFQQFRNIKYNDKKKAKILFHEFKIGLQKHIVWEEEILFPLFEQRTGMHDNGPTAIMRLEHRQIKEFLERIHDKIATGTIREINELENGLIEVLIAHNNKEDNILYPWIDNSVSEEEREDAFTRMKNLPAEKYNKCCE